MLQNFSCSYVGWGVGGETGAIVGARVVAREGVGVILGHLFKLYNNAANFLLYIRQLKICGGDEQVRGAGFGW